MLTSYLLVIRACLKLFGGLNGWISNLLLLIVEKFLSLDNFYTHAVSKKWPIFVWFCYFHSGPPILGTFLPSEMIVNIIGDENKPAMIVPVFLVYRRMELHNSWEWTKAACAKMKVSLAASASFLSQLYFGRRYLVTADMQVCKYLKATNHLSSTNE